MTWIAFYDHPYDQQIGRPPYDHRRMTHPMTTSTTEERSYDHAVTSSQIFPILFLCVAPKCSYSKYYRIIYICAQSFYYVDQYIKLHANINSVLFSTTIQCIIYYHLLHFVDLLCQLLATKYAINCAHMTQSLYPLTLRSQFKVKQHAGISINSK